MTTLMTIRIPNGIVESQADVAYVVGKDGRIFCLSLDTGEVLASTDFASKPLAVFKGILIGWSYPPDQPNQIRFFSATRQGSKLLPQWEQVLQLPGWVELRSPEPDDFILSAEVRKGRVTIMWEAHARYRGGAPPPVEVAEGAVHNEHHTLEFDLKSGSMIGKERVEPAPRPERIVPKVKPNTQIVPYRKGTSWDTQTLRAGAVNASLIKTADKPGIILLHKADSGAEAEIRLTDSTEAVAAVTLDGRLILIHEPGKTGPSWQVFSIETGTRVAILGFDPGAEGISVINDRILYVVREDAKGMRRRTLECRIFHTGELMWSFVLDEEALKAPPPPPR